VTALPKHWPIIWRCALIALFPAVIWLLAGPEPQTIWQRAGDRHYQVRYTPGTDEACLIMRIEHITPGLEQFTCWH